MRQVQCIAQERAQQNGTVGEPLNAIKIGNVRLDPIKGCHLDDRSVILGISRATVTKHVASAREKLRAANKTHAVAIAMRMKILG